MASPAVNASTDYFARKVAAGRMRPTASGETGSPRTPLFNRSLSGIYGSPGASLRNDDENNVVVEVGSRFMRVGSAGEAYPRAILSFGPDEQRRVGDYRQWMPDYEANRRKRKRKRGQSWGREFELWRDDIRDLDLSLVEDKLERAVRQVDGEIVMLDDRKKRITLIVASELPRPLLSIVLSTLFNQFQAPTITVFPTSVASVTGSGLRSGVVLDIGWNCTTVTVVYEYRDILHRRGSRAGQPLSEELAKLLTAEYTRQVPYAGEPSFQETEEILTRLAWCRPSPQGEHYGEVFNSSEDVSIPILASCPPATLSVPFELLSEPAELVFFGKKSFDSDGYEKAIHDGRQDFLLSRAEEHDQPLHFILFNALLAVPIDVRKICMSRIMFTGGTSHLPGLKSRILEEFKLLVEKRGWDPIRHYGKATKLSFNNSTPRARALSSATKTSELLSPATEATRAISPDSETPRVKSPVNEDLDLSPTKEPPHPAQPAVQLTQDVDQVMASIDRQNSKKAPPSVEGEVRAVETLGAWAGGSLMANLRIRGVVEVEREAFLQHGLASAVPASKEKEIVSKAAQRHSLAAGGERKSWTLGIWG